MVAGRKPRDPALGSMAGVRHCVCDPAAYPNCPGHRPPFLAGQRTRTRASLQTMAAHAEKAAEDRACLKLLRPHDSEADIERRMLAKSGWTAYAVYHWPRADQTDEEEVYKPLGLPTGGGLGLRSGGAAASAAMPARSRAVEPPPESTRIVNSLYTSDPARGQRVAFVDEDDRTLRGEVLAVEKELGDREGEMISLVTIRTDGGAVVEASPGTRFTILGVGEAATDAGDKRRRAPTVTPQATPTRGSPPTGQRLSVHYRRVRVSVGPTPDISDRETMPPPPPRMPRAPRRRRAAARNARARAQQRQGRATRSASRTRPTRASCSRR